MMKFKCTRCNKVISGRTEMEAEIKFENHVCKNLPKISKMSDETLLQFIRGEITEIEAYGRTI